MHQPADVAVATQVEGLQQRCLLCSGYGLQKCCCGERMLFMALLVFLLGELELLYSPALWVGSRLLRL